ncbi:SDR family NAD(P)-dependent oxidoreductase [Pelomonas sp. KK5]|uniref:SDR family NAD(P)-dependent oxidoreductase n=1 Tax=Pelomonas sp. KK5 TaxID=1855730 RepID=UPI00097C1C32|nr:SDR family oxidoreductase [Pelomonas sp. KK5]
MEQRYKGRSVVITGAGSGIGRASAMRFAQEGASVLATDLNADTAAQTAQAIVDAGGKAISLKVDAGVEADIRAMIERAMEAHGRIDVLFNNAVNTGANKGKPDKDFLSFDPERFWAIVNVNVLGGVLACKYAIPHMLKQGGGNILWTSSTSSLGGDASQFSYGASKSMVNWYAQTMAATFGKQGIRSNCILPGVIQTPAMKGWANEAMNTAFLDINSSTRLGEPEDVAALAAFLCSDEAHYINGVLMPCDGGMSCGIPHLQIVRNLLKAG